MRDLDGSYDCANQVSIDDLKSLNKNLESEVRELKLQLEFQGLNYKKSLAQVHLAMKHVQNLQLEVERYYLLSQQQKKIIESLEELQSKSNELIYNHIVN